MNLYAKLCGRAAQGKPLRVGLIGAGKFAAMYLAQVPNTPGVHLVGIADLSPQSARSTRRPPRASLTSATTGARWSRTPRSTS
jgi:predicted homoserine dehydrogenase-like protein